MEIHVFHISSMEQAVDPLSPLADILDSDFRINFLSQILKVDVVQGRNIYDMITFIDLERLEIVCVALLQCC